MAALITTAQYKGLGPPRGPFGGSRGSSIKQRRVYFPYSVSFTEHFYLSEDGNTLDGSNVGLFRELKILSLQVIIVLTCGQNVVPEQDSLTQCCGAARLAECSAKVRLYREALS